MWEEVVNDDRKNGVILLDLENFLAQAEHFYSEMGFAVLLPFTKDKVLRKLAEQRIDVPAVLNAVNDERSKDVSFTAFDHVRGDSSTETRFLVQFGECEVHRLLRPGPPAAITKKRSIKVLVELTKEETCGSGDRQDEKNWDCFRNHDLHYLREYLKFLVPADHIVEHALRMRWSYWNSPWEIASATLLLTPKGYEILSKRAYERKMLIRLFLEDQEGGLRTSSPTKNGPSSGPMKTSPKWPPRWPTSTTITTAG